MSLYNYSMGTDLPPALRNAILDSGGGAESFNALSADRQQAVITGAGSAVSAADIEELMKQSDAALCSDICAAEYRDIGSKPL